MVAMLVGHWVVLKAPRLVVHSVDVWELSSAAYWVAYLVGWMGPTMADVLVAYLADSLVDVTVASTVELTAAYLVVSSVVETADLSVAAKVVL